MLKRTLTILLTAAMLAATVSVVMAYGDGNYRKGKYLFRKNCRVCHTEGAKAKELSPVSKTMDEWVQAFKAEKVATYPCKDEWGKLADQDLNDIYTYLHKHAKDSPTPLKCK